MNRMMMHLDSRGASAVKLLAVIVVVVAVAAVCVGLYDSYKDKDAVSFGLSTTSTTVNPGDSVYIIPQYGISATDVKWSSSDTGIATVSDEGEVTVSENAQYNSTVIITAVLSSDVRPDSGSSMITVKSGSATCTVTVGDGSVADTKIYNLSTTSYDYAVIGEDADDAFSQGLLALSFNSNGNMVITLAGYDPSWLGKGHYSTGNAVRDWDSITLTVTAPDGSQYANTFSYNYGERTSSNQYQISYDGPTLVIKSANLTKGDYSVTVVLSNTSSLITKAVTISASFEYKSGDGTLDCTGKVCRQYTWVYDGETYTLRYTMDYGRYETLLAKNIKNFEKLSTSSNQRNYSQYKDIINLISYGSEITGLADELKELYGESNTLRLDEDYAGFLLTFVQICFYYEYDALVNGQLSNSMIDCTDYWSYPAETLYLGCGDCEDTSIFAAALFIASGYSAGVTLLPGHAIASVALDSCSTAEYYTYKIRADTQKVNGTTLTYYGCETTTESAFGIGLVNSAMDGTDDYSKTGTGDCKEAMYVSYNGKWYSA